MFKYEKLYHYRQMIHVILKEVGMYGEPISITIGLAIWHGLPDVSNIRVSNSRQLMADSRPFLI